MHKLTTVILFYGNPIVDFSLERELDHGEPLSPFLFLIALDNLYVMVRETNMLIFI